MDKKNEYVAIAKKSAQISPDDWDVWDEVFKMTDETTIGELRQWYMTRFGLSELDKSKVEMNGIRISQVHNPQNISNG